MNVVKVIASSLQEGLNQVSDTFPLEREKIDFDLIHYETFYRGTVDEEWYPLAESQRLEDVTTEIEIRSPSFEVRQEYTFVFHETQPHPFFDLKLTLALDKSKSKAIAIIHPSSIIPLKKGIQEYIKEQIYKKKLQAGLLLGITDNDLTLQINQLLLKIQKQGPLSEPYRMAITDFFPPIQPTDDTIILHYKKHPQALIEGIQTDDLIFEYIHASRGQNGRSCSGEYISVDEPRIRYINSINIDHTSIRAEEDEKSIRFYALQSGFVQHEKGTFSIGHEIRLKNASFKDTGSIETGSDKEVYLKIDHQDNTKDAIGSRVHIDVQTLEVEGTVGSHTKIQACDVTIGAQTHKKSIIEVQENATIHLHRGDLRAKNATIEILEAGKIEAVNVQIDKMMGGEIIAENVVINTLYSNATITALKSIEIQSIVGDGNNLIINPRAIGSYETQIQQLEKEIQSDQMKVQKKGQELLAKELKLKDQMNRIKQLQLKIKQTLARNETPLKAEMIRLQQFKNAMNELHSEQQSIQDDEELIRGKKHQLQELLEADIHATITHHGSYNGATRIHFIDPKNTQKYAITPQGAIRIVRLQPEGEDKRIVFES